jgi:hypothetical protein
MEVFESFAHPSNHGKWSPLLIRFQYSIVGNIAKRAKRYPAREVDADGMESLCRMLYQPLEWSLFSKSPQVVLMAAQALQQLASLHPEA